MGKSVIAKFAKCDSILIYFVDGVDEDQIGRKVLADFDLRLCFYFFFHAKRALNMLFLVLTVDCKVLVDEG